MTLPVSEYPTTIIDGQPEPAIICPAYFTLKQAAHVRLPPASDNSDSPPHVPPGQPDNAQKRLQFHLREFERDLPSGLTLDTAAMVPTEPQTPPSSMTRSTLRSGPKTTVPTPYTLPTTPPSSQLTPTTALPTPPTRPTSPRQSPSPPPTESIPSNHNSHAETLSTTTQSPNTRSHRRRSSQPQAHPQEPTAKAKRFLRSSTIHHPRIHHLRMNEGRRKQPKKGRLIR